MEGLKGNRFFPLFLTQSRLELRQVGCGVMGQTALYHSSKNEPGEVQMHQITENSVQTLAESLGPIPRLSYFSRRFQCEECEIVQELEVAFHQNPDPFLCADNSAAYLKRAVRNKAISLWRKNKKSLHTVPLDENQYPNESNVNDFANLEKEEGRRQLHEAIERLPARYQDIVFACSIHGVGLAEYAESIGIHPECAKSRLRRAIKTLASDSILRDWFC